MTRVVRVTPVETMRILFVTRKPYTGVSSPTNIYFPLLTAQRGHCVGVIAHKGGNQALYSDAPFEIFEVDEQKLRWEIAVRRIVQQFAPDVIHVFSYWKCGLLPYVLRTVTRAAIILDMRPPLITNNPTRVRTQLKRWKNRLDSLGYDALTAVTVESGQTVIGKSNRITPVSFGVDFASASEKDIATISDSTPLRMVYIGILARTRRLTTLIEAVQRAASRVPLQLDIYGAGDDEDNLHALSAPSGELIRFRGEIPRSELWQRLIQYDLSLCYVPKLRFDAAPALKTLESLACGMPVLATATRGNALFIEHGVNGWLAEETREAFADAIVTLARDPDLRRRLASQSRKSVMHYDWKNIVEQDLLPLYSRILGAHIKQ